jgi:hypothetical protein
VARLHNGTLKVEDNMPGLKVVIEVPLAAHAAALLPPAPVPALAPPGTAA